MRFSEPTIASTLAHLDLSRSAIVLFGADDGVVELVVEFVAASSGSSTFARRGS